MKIEEYWKSFESLKTYIVEKDFKGWDPYDGLNSSFFNMTTLRKSPNIRWLWIQLFKRNPINFRGIVGINEEYNPKAIALVLSGYCNLFKINPIEEYIEKIEWLADKLISLKVNSYSGACWGYNFDWQIRNKYFFPKNTPTVVVTSFAIDALAKAYEITKIEKYKEIIVSTSNFIVKDLKRTKHKKGFLFSYSPLNGNDLVINASLLGAQSLAVCYQYSANKELLILAHDAIGTCAEEQNVDGSWNYGLTSYQKWIDSFHTGYNLCAIKKYQEISSDYSFERFLEKGFDFYINNFFLENGIPKYYYNNVYPIDIHCPAQLFVTLAHIDKSKKYNTMSCKVLDWTIKNMQTKKGYFIYQKKRIITSKIPYMRWSQAFMFYGMSYFLINSEG